MGDTNKVSEDYLRGELDALRRVFIDIAMSGTDNISGIVYSRILSVKQELGDDEEE